MNYIPKPDDENINFNVQNSSPLKDFIILVVGASVLIFLLVMASGWLGETVAKRMSADWEEKIFPASTQQLLFKEKIQTWPELDRVVKKLSPDQGIRTFIICDATPNAFAIPGLQIGVTSGLLKMLKTENGLAMVLAHEIGHFQGHHHILGLGRSLGVSMVLSVLGIGQESVFLSELGQALSQRTYSREHEAEADRIAIALMIKTYGHLNGSDEFFAGLLEEEDTELIRNFPEFLSTHPLTKDRYSTLQTAMQASQKGQIQILHPLPSLCVDQ